MNFELITDGFIFKGKRKKLNQNYSTYSTINLPGKIEKKIKKRFSKTMVH